LIPDLLTVSELAPRLRMKPAKLRALANRGELVFYRIGRAMLFSPADVDAFLEDARRDATGGGSRRRQPGGGL
jgi:excisionase family DNA binding protein